MLLQCLVLMAISSVTDAFDMSIRSKKTCQPITEGLCKFSSATGYAETMFPNHKYRTQSEASVDLRTFKPLMQIKCHADVALFLCAYHFPLCIEELKMALQPCRSLCEQVKGGCENIMQQYNFNWPFNCTEFTASEAMCVSGSKPTTATTIRPGFVTIPTSMVPTNKTQNGKSKKRKGRVNGKEGDELELKCKKDQSVLIKKVAHKNSKCCSSISKQILNIVCHQKRTCKFKVDKSTFGGHCMDRVGSVTIKFKCEKKAKKQSEKLCPVKG